MDEIDESLVLSEREDEFAWMRMDEL